MKEIYPLTIVLDRYNGTYSGGKYTAWNLDVDEVPASICYDDVACFEFWSRQRSTSVTNKYVVGKGETMQEAYNDLKAKLENK